MLTLKHNGKDTGADYLGVVVAAAAAAAAAAVKRRKQATLFNQVIICRKCIRSIQEQK